MFAREIRFDEAVREVTHILGTATPRSESQIISEAEQLVLSAYRRETGKSLSRSDLYLKSNDLQSAKLLLDSMVLAKQRVQGVPLQHITGFQFFLDHEYEVGPEVLIPRPETEVLVVTAVERLRSLKTTPSLGIEIGLGSGIISIELLSQFSDLQMFATELTSSAIEIAKKNASRILGNTQAETRLCILQAAHSSDVVEPLSSRLSERKADFLITNPPYLISKDEVEAEVSRSEPHTALFAPVEDPVFFYRRVSSDAVSFLRPDGFVFAELPHERAQSIAALFEKDGWNTEIICDLTGRPRVLVAQMAVAKREAYKNG